MVRVAECGCDALAVAPAPAFADVDVAGSTRADVGPLSPLCPPPLPLPLSLLLCAPLLLLLRPRLTRRSGERVLGGCEPAAPSERALAVAIGGTAAAVAADGDVGAPDAPGVGERCAGETEPGVGRRRRAESERGATGLGEALSSDERSRGATRPTPSGGEWLIARYSKHARYFHGA